MLDSAKNGYCGVITPTGLCKQFALFSFFPTWGLIFAVYQKYPKEVVHNVYYVISPNQLFFVIIILTINTKLEMRDCVEMLQLIKLHHDLHIKYFN